MPGRNRTCEDVIERLRRGVQEGLVRCPECAGRMTLRGDCGRNVWVAEDPGTARIRMVRAECSACGCSHSLIPSTLAPRSLYLQWIREKAVQEHKRGKRVKARIAAAMRAVLKKHSAELGVTEAEIARDALDSYAAYSGSVRHDGSAWAAEEAFWDAQIWATAKLNQIPVVLSQGFASGSVIEGVLFENPFAGE